MITSYFTNVSVRFNPFSPNSRSSKLFLSMLPRKGTKIQTSIANAPAHVAITFKDGKRIDLESEYMSVKDLMEQADAHSRRLKLEQLKSV